MKLTKLVPKFVGPFASGEAIEFEPDITVLTGQNDAGKTRLLSLLTKICHSRAEEALRENEVSFSYLTTPARNWQTDTEIGAEAWFKAPESLGGNQIFFQYHLAPKCWGQWGTGTIGSGGQQYGYNRDSGLQRYLPRVVVIPAYTGESVRSQIDLAKPTVVEKALLRLAFERDVDADALVALNPQAHRHAVQKAAGRLNARLSEWLPPTLRYRFSFDSHSDQKNLIFVGLEDSQGEVTPLGHRGSGVQKMIHLLGTLGSVLI